MFSKDTFKKISTYVFLGIVALCFAMFVFAFIKLIKFGTGTSDAKFLNVVQMIFSIVGILVVSVYVSIIKVAKFNSSQFFDILLMVTLFLIFSVFPCFDFFKNNIATTVLFMLLGFVFSVISLSIFFYFEKTQNGTVKANTFYLLFFTAIFEIALFAIFEIILFGVLKSSGIILFERATDVFISLAYSCVGLVICIILSFISICYNKKFLNLCLVTRN